MMMRMMEWVVLIECYLVTTTVEDLSNSNQLCLNKQLRREVVITKERRVAQLNTLNSLRIINKMSNKQTPTTTLPETTIVNIINR